MDGFVILAIRSTIFFKTNTEGGDCIQNAKDAKCCTKDTKGASMTDEEVFRKVLDCSFRVHTNLGPGLLESAYEQMLGL